MSIVLLGQIGFLSGVSAQAAAEPDEETITSYAASEFANIIYRAAFFTYMNNRVIPGDVAKGELTNLTVKAHNANGLEAYEFRGSFSGKVAGISQSYIIPLIAGNKPFWTAVVNDPKFQLSQAGNFFMGLAQIISAYFAEDAAISDFTSALMSVSDMNTLKIHVNSMNTGDFVVLVPQFTVYQRLWNFFILDTTVPTNSFVIREENLTVPDTLPDWVYNGPPVTVL